jgi:hypothetical protein
VEVSTIALHSRFGEWRYFISKLWLLFTLAQDAEKKKVEPKTPLFLRLNQDIVAGAK